jgi:hypothetical protein
MAQSTEGRRFLERDESLVFQRPTAYLRSSGHYSRDGSWRCYKDIKGVRSRVVSEREFFCLQVIRDAPG